MAERSDLPEHRALEQAGARRDEVLGALFDRHRERLARMVRLRMDPRLRARIDPSDVLQETYVEVAARIGEWMRDPRMPFFVWLRFLTAQKLLHLRRFHVLAQRRDVRRQVPIEQQAFPDASSLVMAERLTAGLTSPSVRARRGEARDQIERALDHMGPNDREVLVLRHFEQLTNAEAAQELGIETSAASKRYLRALSRLREILDAAGVGEDVV